MTDAFDRPDVLAGATDERENRPAMPRFPVTGVRMNPSDVAPTPEPGTTPTPDARRTDDHH